MAWISCIAPFRWVVLLFLNHERWALHAVVRFPCVMGLAYFSFSIWFFVPTLLVFYVFEPSVSQVFWAAPVAPFVLVWMFRWTEIVIDFGSGRSSRAVSRFKLVCDRIARLTARHSS